LIWKTSPSCQLEWLAACDLRVAVSARVFLYREELVIETIEKNVQAVADEVEETFQKLAEKTRDSIGITRASYSRQETEAHLFLAQQAQASGLEVSTDYAVNTYMTLPGTDRSLPRVIMGSHLDSVQSGGNYDGAAGVVAGLYALKVLKNMGLKPAMDLCAMGIRGEESVWFQVSYLGSRAALGGLPADALDAVRIDTQCTLREHLIEAGGSPEAIENQTAILKPENVKAFLEVHIEQAPKLVEENLPLGICLAVPAMVMYPDVRITGAYGHVGTPMEYRRDAALAGAQIAYLMDRFWLTQHQSGSALAMTLGRFHTNTQAHGLTTIPGEFFFSIDMRGYDERLLEQFEQNFLDTVQQVEKEKGVQVDLGERRTAPLGVMDPKIIEALTTSAEELKIPFTQLYSPACHDAGAFSAAGIPTGMLFIRNEHGSHNPAESMEIEDFLQSLKVLILWLLKEVG